jgi:hypothetical protein
VKVNLVVVRQPGWKLAQHGFGVGYGGEANVVALQGAHEASVLRNRVRCQSGAAVDKEVFADSAGMQLRDAPGSKGDPSATSMGGRQGGNRRQTKGGLSSLG